MLQLLGFIVDCPEPMKLAARLCGEGTVRGGPTHRYLQGVPACWRMYATRDALRNLGNLLG